MSRILLPWKDYPTGYTEFINPDEYFGGEIVRHEMLRNLHEVSVAEVWQKVFERVHDAVLHRPNEGVVVEKYFLWEGRILYYEPGWQRIQHIKTYHSFNRAKRALEKILLGHGFKLASAKSLSMK